jgi:hypothetical protein
MMNRALKLSLPKNFSVPLAMKPARCVRSLNKALLNK